MAHKFQELQAKMTPQRRARISRRADEMMAEMLLSELRRLTGKTQNELAEALGVRQPTLSQLESQSDMRISTLRRIIESLGGELEIIARVKGREIRLTQFEDEESKQPARV